MSDFAAGFASGVGQQYPQSLAAGQQYKLGQQQLGLEKERVELEKANAPTPEQKDLRIRKERAETARAESLASPDVLAAERAGVMGGFKKAAAEGSDEAIGLDLEVKRATTARAKADAAYAQATTSDDALKILRDMQKIERDKAIASLTGARLDNRLRDIELESAPAMADARLQGALVDLKKAGLGIDEAMLRNKIARFESSDRWLSTRQQAADTELAAARSRDARSGEEAALNKLRVLYELSGQRVDDDVLAERAKDSFRFLAQVYDATGDEGAALESADALDRIMSSKTRIEESGVTKRPVIEAYRKALAEIGDISQLSAADVNRPGFMQRAAAKLQAIAEMVSPTKTSLTKPETSQDVPEPDKTSARTSLSNPFKGLGSDGKRLYANVAADVTGTPVAQGATLPASLAERKDFADKYFVASGGSTVVPVGGAVLKLPSNEKYKNNPREAKLAEDFDKLMSPRGGESWRALWDGLSGNRKASGIGNVMPLPDVGIFSTRPSSEDLARLKDAWVKFETLTGDSNKKFVETLPPKWKNALLFMETHWAKLLAGR